MSLNIPAVNLRHLSQGEAGAVIASEVLNTILWLELIGGYIGSMYNVADTAARETYGKVCLNFPSTCAAVEAVLEHLSKTR